MAARAAAATTTVTVTMASVAALTQKYAALSSPLCSLLSLSAALTLALTCAL